MAQCGKAAFGLELTDETFALHSSNFSSALPEKATIFSINVTAQLAWVLGSALGALLGWKVDDIYTLGLDFALPAMFIALLVIQIKDRSHILVALATMLVPSLLITDGRLNFSQENLYFGAALPCLWVAWRTRSLLGTVGTGLVIVIAARLLGT